MRLHDRSRRTGGLEGKAGIGGVMFLGLLVLVIAVAVIALQKTGGVGEALESVRDVASPEPRLVTMPQGTEFVVSLETRLTTKESRAGDAFSAVVTAPVSVGTRLVVPAGAKVSGRVLRSEQPGKASGRGTLQLAFDELVLDGVAYALGSRSPVFESASGTGKDAGLITGTKIRFTLDQDVAVREKSTTL